MYDAFGLEKSKSSQELTGKSADEREREALEIVRADELVKIDGETRRDDAEMRAEVEGGGDAQSCVRTVGIL